MSGTILKKKREDLGLDIREISVLLKINREYLSSIESDEFGKLPAPVYTIGYIRSYSAYLGVDPSDIIAVYSRQLPPPKTDVSVMPVILDNQTKRSKAVYIVLALLIGTAGLLLYFKIIRVQVPVVPVPQVAVRDNPDTTVAKKIPAAKKQAETPGQGSVQSGSAPLAETAVTAPEVKPPPAVAVPGQTDGAMISDQKTASTDNSIHRLSVTAADTSWIYMKFKNGKHQELTMRPGETKEWSFSEGASLKIGNAGGIQVVFDGKNLGPAGKKNEVVTLQFPPGD